MRRSRLFRVKAIGLCAIVCFLFTYLRANEATANPISFSASRLVDDPQQLPIPSLDVVVLQDLIATPTQSGVTGTTPQVSDLDPTKPIEVEYGETYVYSSYAPFVGISVGQTVSYTPNNLTPGASHLQLNWVGPIAYGVSYSEYSGSHDNFSGLWFMKPNGVTPFQIFAYTGYMVADNVINAYLRFVGLETSFVVPQESNYLEEGPFHQGLIFKVDSDTPLPPEGILLDMYAGGYPYENGYTPSTLYVGSQSTPSDLVAELETTYANWVSLRVTGTLQAGDNLILLSNGVPATTLLSTFPNTRTFSHRADMNASRLYGRIRNGNQTESFSSSYQECDPPAPSAGACDADPPQPPKGEMSKIDNCGGAHQIGATANNEVFMPVGEVICNHGFMSPGTLNVCSSYQGGIITGTSTTYAPPDGANWGSKGGGSQTTSGGPFSGNPVTPVGGSVTGPVDGDSKTVSSPFSGFTLNGNICQTIDVPEVGTCTQSWSCQNFESIVWEWCICPYFGDKFCGLEPASSHDFGAADPTSCTMTSN